MPSDVLAIIILLVVVALIGVAIAATLALVIGFIAFFFRGRPINDLDASFREQLAVCKVNHAPHRKNLYMLDVPHLSGLQREMMDYRKTLMILRKEVETKCLKQEPSSQQ